MQTQEARASGGPAGERREGARVDVRARSGRERGTSRSGRAQAEQLARGIGWFSLGLGALQMAAPREVSRLIGLRGNRRNRKVMRGIGVREIAVGIGILTRAQPAGWIWSRVGGDLTDLGLMGSVLAAPRVNQSRAKGAMMALIGITMADLFTGRQLGRRASGVPSRARRARRPVEESITVGRSPDEVYRFWRDLRNLPRFMEFLESVEVIDHRRSRWTAKVAGGKTISWHAEITEDRPNERIAWRSIGGSRVVTSGVVRFVRAPGDRGTEIHVRMGYQLPGGAIGKALGKLTGGVVGTHVASDLRRFKQVMEIGEVVQSDASIHRGPHPAQPSAATPTGRAGDGRREPERAQGAIAASPGGGAR